MNEQPTRVVERKAAKSWFGLKRAEQSAISLARQLTDQPASRQLERAHSTLSGWQLPLAWQDNKIDCRAVRLTGRLREACAPAAYLPFGAQTSRLFAQLGADDARMSPDRPHTRRSPLSGHLSAQ